jgi:integrase/recombinase XerD
LETYSETLRTDWETLTHFQKRLRLTLDEHLSSLRARPRYDFVLRLRRIAQFLRLGRRHWRKVVDQVFALDSDGAEALVSRYRAWMNTPGRFSTKVKIHLNPWCLQRFSKILQKRGLISWHLKHVRTRQAEVRFTNTCPTFRGLIADFLREQSVRNLTESTLSCLRSGLVDFASYLADRSLSFESLEYQHALSWMEEMRRSGLAPIGLNRKLHIVKRFYRWLTARKLIQESPFETFMAVRVSRKLPKILSEPEIVRLIKGASSTRTRAILEFLYATGCRAGELRRTDLNAISFEDRTLRTTGKGGHEQTLYLNDSALRAIRAYLPERAALLKGRPELKGEALFLKRDGTRITTYTIRNVVVESGRRAGLSHGVHPHMLRHSFATHLLNRGADLFSIMQFLGHRNIQSTVRYLQIATTKLSEIHRRYHPRK